MAAAIIFLSAFLLFLVQPMVAKTLLPAFGGTYAVWAMCLLFFQTALLAGYAYAHWTRRVAHMTVVIAAAAVAGAPTPNGLTQHPVAALLLALIMSIGLPALALSSTSPLAQRWSGLAVPYRLYAVSNLASLAGLLAYPVLIEPFVSLKMQWAVWKIGLAVFALLWLLSLRRSDAIQTDPARLRMRPGWLLLPACSSGLLMAITNHLTQEVAPVPFLWILPLAAYLGTFILCFEFPGFYTIRVFGLVAAFLIPLSTTMAIIGLNASFWIIIFVHLATLFVCAMICHGELAKSKPDKEYLTSYYLGIAAGGALGGFFVAIVAPLLFTTSFLELPLLLAACALAALPAQFADRGPFRNAALIGLGLAVLVPIKAALPDQAVSTIAARRNFYGLLRVVEDKTSRTLSHGATIHGMQLLARHSTPTTYYGYVSGVGQAIERHAAAGPIRLGVVGLGTGTLARYGRPGDVIRFYELNPMVPVLARQYFTFLSDSQARVEIVEGDARLRMQQEEPQKYDVLVIDAFSSDAIPVHLLTAEAARVYARHLAPNGSLLIHISNQTLNLEPVVRGVGKLLNMSAQRVDTNDDPSQGVTAASWMVLESATGSAVEPSLLWTDDFSALLPIMKPVRRRGL